MAKTITRTMVCESVAKSLRQFGYPDVDRQMIDEILTGWLEGKRFPDLPHGVIAGFAESQFYDVTQRGLDLSTLPA